MGKSMVRVCWQQALVFECTKYAHGARPLGAGDGKLTFPDGGFYEGQFAEDEINGQGTRRYTNGNVYTGGC